MIDEDAGVVHFHKSALHPARSSEAIATGIGQMLADHDVSASRKCRTWATAPPLPPTSSRAQRARELANHHAPAFA